MKKSNKIIVVVVLVLVILFGVGQFFASSTIVAPSGSHPSGSASSTLQTIPNTQVMTYVPPQPTPSTPIEKGSCWTSSIAAPFRPDAWRCTVGNSISDPCFQIPNSKELLCGINPSVADATSTFVLSLTQSLPPAQTTQITPPSNWAWLVELSDGTLCTPFTGTLPFTATGESANYGCAPGPLGNNLVIFGDLNASTSVWTANIGTLTETTSSLPVVATSSTVPIAEVWQ